VKDTNIDRLKINIKKEPVSMMTFGHMEMGVKPTARILCMWNIFQALNIVHI